MPEGRFTRQSHGCNMFYEAASLTVLCWKGSGQCKASLITLEVVLALPELSQHVSDRGVTCLWFHRT